MLDKNMVGLDWSTFFIGKNGEEINKKQLLEELKRCNQTENYYNQYKGYIKGKYIDFYDENTHLALERVLYRFLVQDTTFALDVLTEEEYLKAQDLVARKQFTSKLLKQLNGKFSYLLHCENNKFGEILMLDVFREKSIIYEEKANKSFLELKPVIDKITSGIKSICYLQAENKRFSGFGFKLDEQSNELIKQKYLYDLNSSVRSNSLFLWDFDGKYLEVLFKKKLFSDEKFWEKHADFSITSFIKLVRENNSDVHANKIITYIFEEIKKDDFANKLIENNLSLIYLDREVYLKRIQIRTFNFSFGRFGLKKPFEDLPYPLIAVDRLEDKLKKGKEVFEKILYKEIYPHAKDVVKKFFESEVINPQPILKGQSWTILDMLDSFTFAFHNTEDKRVVKLICENYFTFENILNRVYIKSYYLSEISKDVNELSYNFFELFYDLTQAIEKRINIQTTFQRDKSIRKNAFEKLKENLVKYGVTISDKYEDEYVISLLDRKIANFEEAEKFPVLEQIGDAIYGFAVAELLFYNPRYNDDNCNYYSLHDDYIKAEKQVEICKKIEFDKLYLRSSTIAHKYEYDRLIDPDNEIFSMRQVTEGYSVKEKYLADSLEMIIGTIYKDCGIKQALDFTKDIIKITFPEVFTKEIKEDGKEDFLKFYALISSNSDSKDIERDYFRKILPSLYGEMECSHGMINRALCKLTLTLCLGTDSVNERNYITNNHSDSVVKDEPAEGGNISRFLHGYFYKGIEFVIKKYKKEIINNYKNK